LVKKETPVPNGFLEAAELYDRLRACKDSLMAILSPEKLIMLLNILETLIRTKGAEKAMAFFGVPFFLAVAFLSAEEKMERSLPDKVKERKLNKLPCALNKVLFAMHPDAAQADPPAVQPSAPAPALSAEIRASQGIGDLEEADQCLGPAKPAQQHLPPHHWSHLPCPRLPPQFFSERKRIPHCRNFHRRRAPLITPRRTRVGPRPWA